MLFLLFINYFYLVEIYLLDDYLGKLLYDFLDD